MSTEKDKKNEEARQPSRLGKVYGVIRESQFPVALAQIEREGKDPKYQIVTLLPDQSDIYWKGAHSPSLDAFELTRLHHILNERLLALEDPDRDIKGISSHHMGPEKTEWFDITEHWGMINSSRYENARLEVNMVTFRSFENEEGETIPETTKLEIREWQDGLPRRGYRFSGIEEVMHLKEACEVLMKEKDLTYETQSKNKLEKKPAKEEDKPRPKTRDDPQK